MLLSAHTNLDGRVFLTKADEIAQGHVTRWFSKLIVDRHSAYADFMRGQATSFIKASHPKPFVEPDFFYH